MQYKECYTPKETKEHIHEYFKMKAEIMKKDIQKMKSQEQNNFIEMR